MCNIVTYAQGSLDPFRERPFCAVDSLVLAQLAYLHLPAAALPALCRWDGMPLRDLLRAEYFAGMFRQVRSPEDNRRLLSAVAASPRFRDVRVCGYTEQVDAGQEKQFGAVTFRLDGQTAYVAFRGTDSTLLGWKEDFNMAFQSPVPSQEEALRYLEAAARQCPGALLAGGHSKGGNLAVYAAMKCGAPAQDRIVRIYSHDGPGFKEDVLNSGAFRRIGGRVDKTLPQSSVIGMLLEHQEDFRVVRSTRAGLMQHDPFSWVVQGNAFCVVEQLSASARYMDRTLNAWIRQFNDQDRERFVDALYGILNASEAETIPQLRAGWQRNIPAVARAAAQTDPDTRAFLLRTVRALAVLGVKNFPRPLRGGKEN